MGGLHCLWVPCTACMVLTVGPMYCLWCYFLPVGQCGSKVYISQVLSAGEVMPVGVSSSAHSDQLIISSSVDWNHQAAKPNFRVYTVIVDGPFQVLKLFES